jgi:hypothetical protein
VVALSKLEADLASVSTTANFTFITPNVCNDGHDGDGTGAAGKGCVDGKPGGLTTADAFLKTWVPKILASAAYKQDGLLIINFDESANSLMTTAVNSSTGKVTINAVYKGESCCGQQMGPNITRPLNMNYPILAPLTAANEMANSINTCRAKCN